MKSTFKSADITSFTKKEVAFSTYENALKKDVKRALKLGAKEATAITLVLDYEFPEGRKVDLAIVGDISGFRPKNMFKGHKIFEGYAHGIKGDARTLHIRNQHAKLTPRAIKLINKQLKPMGLWAQVAEEETTPAPAPVSTEEQKEAVLLKKKLSAFVQKGQDTLIDWRTADESILYPRTDENKAIVQKREALDKKVQQVLDYFALQQTHLEEVDNVLPNLKKMKVQYKKVWEQLLTYKANTETYINKVLKQEEEKRQRELEQIVINPIVYHNVREKNIEDYDDEGHLANLQKGILNDRHRKTGSLINKPLHQHLQNGSRGMAFTYLENSDNSITPVIYDYAKNRQGNKYEWENGNQITSGPPSVPNLNSYTS